MSDINQVDKPIEVSASQGTNDALQAAMRYVVVILTALPVITSLLQTRDVLSIINYFQGSAGALVITAAVSLGTLAYGLFKTKKRGAQMATVAADDRVPHSIARLK